MLIWLMNSDRHATLRSRQETTRISGPCENMWSGMRTGHNIFGGLFGISVYVSLKAAIYGRVIFQESSGEVFFLGLSVQIMFILLMWTAARCNSALDFHSAEVFTRNDFQAFYEPINLIPLAISLNRW